MMANEKIAQLVKEAIKRQFGRTGRTFQGTERMKRELDAAGRTRQDHGTSFSYPRGTPVKPSFEQEDDDPKQASADRLAALCRLE